MDQRIVRRSGHLRRTRITSSVAVGLPSIGRGPVRFKIAQGRNFLGIGSTDLNRREVHFRARNVVDQVGEEDLGQHGDDFDDLAFAEPGFLHRLDILCRNLASSFGNLAGRRKRLRHGDRPRCPGQTSAKAIEQMRLVAARLMIEATRHPMDQIALESGFIDIRRMREAFVRQYGQPPQTPRRLAKAA